MAWRGGAAVASLLMMCSMWAGAADWPQWRGDAARNGGVPGGPVARQWRPAWEFDAHAEISASPVVADGKILIAAENGNLYALDARSHALAWLYHADGGIASTPAVAGGKALFLSRDGVFQAVDLKDGHAVWRFRTRGEARFAAFGMFGTPLGAQPQSDPWDVYLSSPLVAHGKVYFGSSDERLYAMDVATGQPAWVYKTGGMVHSSPALAGANVVVGSWDGAVYALDAATGELRWRHQTDTEQKASIMFGVQASPVSDGQTVFIGSRDGFFYALDAAKGTLKWRYDCQGSWVAGSAALDRDRLYVPTSDTGLVLALDKATGKELFRHVTSVWNFASPVFAQGLLATASTRGALDLLDPATGKVVWSWQTAEGRADAHHIVSARDGKYDGARLFEGHADKLPAALEHVKRLGAFFASPAWADGELIVADALGRVRAFVPQR